MVRVNLLKNKSSQVSSQGKFSQIQKAEMIFTAVVAVALVVMIFLPQ